MCSIFGLNFSSDFLGSVDEHHIRDIIFEARFPSDTCSNVALLTNALPTSPDRQVWTGRSIYTHGAAGCWMMSPLSSPMPTWIAVIHIMISRLPEGMPTVTGLIDWH